MRMMLEKFCYHYSSQCINPFTNITCSQLNVFKIGKNLKEIDLTD